MDNLTENSRVMSQQIRGVCNDNYLRANDQGQQTSKRILNMSCRQGRQYPFFWSAKFIYFYLKEINEATVQPLAYQIFFPAYLTSSFDFTLFDSNLDLS